MRYIPNGLYNSLYRRNKILNLKYTKLKRLNWAGHKIFSEWILQ